MSLKPITRFNGEQHVMSEIRDNRAGILDLEERIGALEKRLEEAMKPKPRGRPKKPPAEKTR